MTTDRYNPHPHRCAGLPDFTRAYAVVLPQGERVQVYADYGECLMDSLVRAFPYCPGCGAHASFLLAPREPSGVLR